MGFLWARDLMRSNRKHKYKEMSWFMLIQEDFSPCSIWRCFWTVTLLPSTTSLITFSEQYYIKCYLPSIKQSWYRTRCALISNIGWCCEHCYADDCGRDLAIFHTKQDRLLTFARFLLDHEGSCEMVYEGLWSLQWWSAKLFLKSYLTEDFTSNHDWESTS